MLSRVSIVCFAGSYTLALVLELSRLLFRSRVRWPLIVACAADTSRVMRCGLPCHPIDVAIALEHIALAAAAEGLGTCWIGAFHQDQVRQVLGIPAEAKVIELMTLGYPVASATPKTKNRKTISEIVCYEQWK